MSESEELNVGQGVHGPSFLLGLVGGALLGVVATVAFAAYREEQFRTVTGKTRQLGDSAQEKAAVVKQRAVASVNGVAESAKANAKRAGDTLSEKVSDIAAVVKRKSHKVDPEV